MTELTSLVLIVSGPSGVGKSTALAALADLRNVSVITSITTRKRRANEIDGVDYHFVEEGRFLEMVSRGEFLEWVLYDGHYYGTPRAAVERVVEKGGVAVLEIERQGTMVVRELFENTVAVLLQPPHPGELERRLRSRGATDEFLNRRLALAREDPQDAGTLYDVVLTSTETSETVKQLCRIIDSCYVPN